MPPPDPPVQIIPNGSSSSPSAPVQVVANGSGSSPAAPPTVVDTVIPGSNAILVTGSLTGDTSNPIVVPPLIRTSDWNGRMAFTDTGLPMDATLPEYFLAWLDDPTPYWLLQKTDLATTGSWQSFSDTESPLDAVGWAAIAPSGGVPVLELSSSDAPQTPQVIANGSSGSPSAPVQIVANGSSSAPSAPPVVIP